MHAVEIDTNIHVLFVLILIVSVLNIWGLFTRRFNLKGFICSIILSVSAVFWIINGLGDMIGFPPSLYHMEAFGFVPFGKLFFVPSEGNWSSTEAHLNYLMPIITYLAVTFVFGIIWGILAPTVFKSVTLKEYVRSVFAVIFPVNLLINLSHLFYVSYTEHFDMGSYIMLAAGCFIGWIIHKRIDLRLKKGKEND